MKLNQFLSIKAVLMLAFGAGFLLIPAPLNQIFGITLDPVGAFMVRYVGACALGIGLVCWLFRHAAGQTASGVLLAFFVSDTAGLVVSLMFQLSSLTNPFGWAIVAMWLFLAAGLGYFRFIAPQASDIRRATIRSR